ncbi:MAG: site-2 protease family protein [Armatimonadetes bacterium]|nr:site-2 protease family protein [Armatimonadota bacterium]
MTFPRFDLHEFLIMMAALIICITIHEFAHAYSAWRAGDDTPRQAGRISLNPLDHLDPMGTVMMVVSSLAGFGIGWGKPVGINPHNFRHPRWDNLRVSLWGPLSNVLTAVVTGTVLRFLFHGLRTGGVTPTPVMMNVTEFVMMLTLISIGLAVFNLIPIAPLDGSHILSALLPYEMARKYDRFMGQFGMLMFVGLIVAGGEVLPAVLGPPRDFLWNLVTGGLRF